MIVEAIDDKNGKISLDFLVMVNGLTQYSKIAFLKAADDMALNGIKTSSCFATYIKEETIKNAGIKIVCILNESNEIIFIGEISDVFTDKKFIHNHWIGSSSTHAKWKTVIKFDHLFGIKEIKTRALPGNIQYTESITYIKGQKDLLKLKQLCIAYLSEVLNDIHKVIRITP